jgi:hypothetical protein
MALFDDPVESAANKFIDKKFEEGYNAKTNAFQRAMVDLFDKKSEIKQQHTEKYREGFHNIYTGAKIAGAIAGCMMMIHHAVKKRSDKKDK